MFCCQPVRTMLIARSMLALTFSLQNPFKITGER